MPNKEELFTDKDLLNTFNAIRNDISTLKQALGETTTLIRDYNGLRETISDVDKRLGKVEQRLDSSKTWVPWVFTIITTLFSIVMFVITIGGKIWG